MVDRVDEAAEVDHATAGPSRRRWLRRLAVIGLALLLLLAALGGTLFLLSEQIGDNVKRVANVFGPLEESARPVPNGALTFLVVGTDAGAPDARNGGPHGDLVMLAQVAQDRKSASVVSIPGNSQVEIPDRGPNRLNDAYAAGGATLLVQTVEKLTDIRVDHFVVLDLAGFQAVVDAVGGVDVGVAAATSFGGVQFQEGVNQLDGAAALAYVRQRQGLPGDELDRAERQQNLLRSLLAKAASSASVADPAGAYALADAVSRAASVDDTLTNARLRELMIELLALDPANVTFLTAPVQSVGHQGSLRLVALDGARAEELWSALGSGSAKAYADKYPADVLGSRPN